MTYDEPDNSTASGPRFGVGAIVDPLAVVGPGVVVEMEALVLAGAIVKEGATVGARAIIEGGAVVEKGAIVGAGAIIEGEAIVRAGAVVPPGALVKTGEVFEASGGSDSEGDYENVVPVAAALLGGLPSDCGR